MSGPEVISFGCRLNLAEGDAIRAANAGADDLIVINSCAVTSEAERQVRQTIRRLARQRPDARIVVTGCASDIDPERYRAMAEVADILPNATKTRPLFGHNHAWQPALSAPGRARAFVEVQNGCDHDCTFCIIPQGRGTSRSAPAGDVIDAIKRAVDRGQLEVVLTGVDLTSYGPDLPGSPSLGQLAERILTAVPELPRLRLSSLDCIEVDARLENLIAHEPRMMPHLHLSFQAGDDMILKRMKRRHSRAQSLALVERLRAKRPDLAIGADLIAGFPTETEDMAENTRRLIEEAEVVFAHIFPFSPRPGTPAARMPQLDRALVKERAARLRETAAAVKRRWHASLVGTVQQLLVESDGVSGHIENFAEVRLASPLPRFHIASVRITGHDDKTLLAEPA
jgi:threonylcarbamoyladenosine tRNA methylthiotransferase MtaB